MQISYRELPQSAPPAITFAQEYDYESEYQYELSHTFDYKIMYENDEEQKKILSKDGNVMKHDLCKLHLFTSSFAYFI